VWEIPERPERPERPLILQVVVWEIPAARQQVLPEQVFLSSYYLILQGM
jgi:hypothetical protein